MRAVLPEPPSQLRQAKTSEESEESQEAKTNLKRLTNRYPSSHTPLLNMMASVHGPVTVHRSHDGAVFTVTLSRPDAKNAVDRITADALTAAFREFEADDTAKVAVLYGDGGVFCAGADLKAVYRNDETMNRIEPVGEADGPMGPSRMELSKPVIGAIAGHAVAGGLELALWCDLRVAEEGSTLGVFCRRWGVPLIDGGTVRLPRLIGLSRALDLILTGRPVDAEEAERIGLVNRVVPKGTVLAEAQALASTIASFPQLCMRQDRLSAYEESSLSLPDALANEFEHGLVSLADVRSGVAKFASGEGRHGSFDAFTRNPDIDAVVFDLGGVVFDSPIALITEYEKEIGLERHIINRMIAGAGENGAFQRMERGELTTAEFPEPFDEECRAAGLPGVSGHKLMELIMNVKPRPVMLECIEQLRGNGFKTGILTNNYREGHEPDGGGGMADALTSMVDVVVESVKVGLRKPDPKIYEHVATKLDVPPGRIVYLDDIGYNLKPARALGMTTIRVGLDDRTGAKAVATLQRIVGVPLLKVMSRGRL